MIVEINKYPSNGNKILDVVEKSDKRLLNFQAATNSESGLSEKLVLVNSRSHYGFRFSIMTKSTSYRQISQLVIATSRDCPHPLSGMPCFLEVLALAQNWPQVKETRPRTMPWIEMIGIRSLKTSDADWLKAINEVTNDITQTDADVSIEILRNASIETDLIIELTHHSGEVEVEGSSTGVRLASMCASHGLVNHSVWLEDGRRVGQKRISIFRKD